MIRGTIGPLDGYLLPIAVLWNILTWIVAERILPDAWGYDGLWQTILTVSIQGIALALALAAIFTLIRRRKYGRVFLRAERLPMELGQWIQVEVSGNRPFMAIGHVDCLLICAQKEWQHSHRRDPREHILWQYRWSVNAETITNADRGWAVAFDLPLPCDVPELNHIEPSLWRLEVRVPTTGIDFFATFPLEVDPTPDLQAVGDKSLLTRAAVTQKSLGLGQNADTADEEAEREREREELCQRVGLLRKNEPDRLILSSPPLRFRHTNLAFMIFGLVIVGLGSGLAALYIPHDANYWHPLLLVPLLLFLIPGTVVMGCGFLALLRTFHVQVDRQGLHLRRGLLVLGTPHHIPHAMIVGISVHRSYTAGAGVPQSRVLLEDINGHKHRLTPLIGGKLEVESIAADIRRALAQFDDKSDADNDEAARNGQ